MSASEYVKPLRIAFNRIAYAADSGSFAVQLGSLDRAALHVVRIRTMLTEVESLIVKATTDVCASNEAKRDD